MAQPRRVFRIEQTAAARLVRPAPKAGGSPYHGEIMQALGALQALMAASPALPAADTDGATKTAGAGSRSTLHADNLARIAHELDAVTAGTAQATQKILAAAEEIDQLADNLTAALKGRIEQESAQDIADSVLRIFEACNFQDLISQRVAKVMKTLKPSDAPELGPDDPALHGPRLDDDKGHLSQGDIDAMFNG
jgi:chemotaxis protein CheZ